MVGCVQCPDKEPAQCCYCRVCEACRDTLAIKQCQVARQRSLSAPSSPGSSSVTSVSSDTDDATGRLLKVWQEFYALQAKVDDQLTKVCSNNCTHVNRRLGINSRKDRCK
jgi:hypothetical protein